MKTCIAFLTKDKVELTRQSIQPLLHGDYHLLWIDGSDTEEGQNAAVELAYPRARPYGNVRGGAGAAIVFALTTMLDSPENYTHVGLVEQDVLLPNDWFEPTMRLFGLDSPCGMMVGAVSTRAYQDRVLFQRDGYAVMHNLGAGQIVLTRDAARIVLDTFRTAWTTDNRRIFSLLSGIDIGVYWAFRTNEHPLTADFHWDATLAAHGYASLALTPSPGEMIGQNPPLAEQGLMIVKEPSALTPVGEAAFETYINRLRGIRIGELDIGIETRFQYDPCGTWSYFPHQMHMLRGVYSGDWRLKENRAWGTFAWQAGDGETPVLDIPIFGPCAVLVSGGEHGGKVEVLDSHSGFKATPDLVPEGETGQILQIQVPAGVQYSYLRLTALAPGVKFFGIQTREKQSWLPLSRFDYSNLPPV